MPLWVRNYQSVVYINSRLASSLFSNMVNTVDNALSLSTIFTNTFLVYCIMCICSNFVTYFVELNCLKTFLDNDRGC